MKKVETKEWHGHISNYVDWLLSQAVAEGEPVLGEFNEVEFEAHPSDSRDVVVKRYNDECERRREEYLASDEYKQRVREQQERDAKQKADFESAMATAPATLTVAEGKAERWQEFVDKNSDPYGAACVRYADAWARIMESRLAQGQAIKDCADEASGIADVEGITGFMYGCAVAMLAECWKHGDELRRWHNINTQIGDEGERANESGGVLNPALLNIGGTR